jgi:hypothetical protein
MLSFKILRKDYRSTKVVITYVNFKFFGFNIKRQELY